MSYTAPVPISSASRVILFVTVFIHLLGFGIIIPLLPYYAETYGAHAFHIGLLTTSFSLCQFLFAPVWGRLSDRIGRRPVLIGSLVVTAVSYLIYAAAHSLEMLFVSRMLAGVAGAVLSTAQAYVADTTTPENRTKGMGLIGAAFGMGFIFGPALGGILSQWGYAAPAYASAGLALVAAVFAYFRLGESLPPEVRAETAARRLARAGFFETLKRPVTGTVLGLFFTATVCFAGMEAILALFTQRYFSWGPHQIGYLFAYVGVIAALMQAGIVGRLVKRFGERALVRAGLLLMGAAFVTAGLAPPLGLFILTMGSVSVASGMLTPSLSGLISLATSADEQGSVLGVYQSLGSLARAVGPFLGGFVFDVVSPGAPLWMAGIVLGIAALAAARLPRREAAKTT
ncbi:MAG TPA: MFS transporter [Candidatus Saccharimonadales bacterium]|nr:MFS transporter [Candidatus Saccharimonadales bacterium]